MSREACRLVLVLALVHVFVGEALAQAIPPTDDATGVVARVDDRHKVVILGDGRMLRGTPATIFLVNGSPAALGSLQPGTLVVIRSAEPVVFRSGQYVVLSDSPAASLAVGAVRARTFGRVKDIDGDGDVKIETQAGETLHMKVSPDAARRLKDGDTVTVEVIITPPTVR